MSELNRLVRPAQSQVGLSPSPKECHAEGIKYPSFRQLNKTSRVLLSPQYLSTDQNFVYRNFVVSNKKGWFAAIQTNAETFSAILSPLKDLRKAMKEATSGVSPFTPQRILSFSTSEPNILAFACNDSRLIIGFKSGQIIAYDTSYICTPGSDEIPPLHVFQSSQQPILDITSNPNDEDPNLTNLLVTVRADGTVQLLNSSLEPQGGWVASDAESTPVAVAWSPKGKQLAIGLRQGDILTFTLDNKSSPLRHIPPTTQGTLVSLSWLAPGHTFRTTYAASEPIHYIVHSEKRSSPIVWTRLDYSFQLSDRNRQNPYSAVLTKWDDQADDRILVVIGDMSCTDLEVLGNVGNEWYQQSQENPLSIPLDKESEDTVLLSLQVDFTDTDTNEGGCPILYAYLNDGTIQGWYVDHPEKKPYAGMMGHGANITSSTFDQPQRSPALGTQLSAGQSSAFSPTPTSLSFGKTSAIAAFGQPSFGQQSFVGQSASESAPNLGLSNSSGGFASFASSSASPFGTGSFGSPASVNTSSFGNHTVESPPQMIRDTSMSDSTPAFGGLSLGDSNERPKPGSTFGGASGLFGSPSPLPLPPDHAANSPAQTSAFSSGSGTLIKPATGFGAFGGNNSGSFGSFGNPGNITNNAFSGGAFSAQPAHTSAFAPNNEQTKSVSGQSGFGQSSFGKPSFGQPAFGQSSFGTVPAQPNPISGGFGAFAQTPTSFLSDAASSPASKSNINTGGFASFAGTPSTFGTATSSGKSVFGSASASSPLDTAKQTSDSFSSFASKGSSPFGNKAASLFGSQSPSGGASSNTPSSGPPVSEQLASASGGDVSGGTKTESSSAFKQPSTGGAFGALKSTSSSVFGEPAPPISGGAFGVPFQSSTFVQSTGSPEKEQPTTPIKSEPGSPTLPSSPDSDTPTDKPSSLPVKPSTPGGAFGNMQTSFSTLKPATGFGAFGNTMSSSSPFLKTHTGNEKPVVSAFGTLGSVKPALPSNTLSSSSGPTFGATTQLGFGFGLKPTTSTASPTATSSQGSSTTMTSAFSAFSGTPSPFLTMGGTTKSFGELLKESREDKAEKPAPEAFSQASSITSSTTPASLETAIEKKDDKTVYFEKTSAQDKEQPKIVEEAPNEESISSTSSSFVEIPRSDEHAGDEHDEIPNSEDEFEQHGDEDDFLSESYGSQSGGDEGESEEVEDNGYSEESSSSPEPTEIPLPLSRSRSNTPQAEIPQTEPLSPSTPSSEDTESSRLSTIREESTTPPGSPTKPQTIGSSAIIAPAPINAPLTSLGIGRPNTRPTRSSPLANKPLTGIDESEEQEEEKEPKLTAAVKLHPASPKIPFGVIPSKSRSTSPEESKLIDGRRPKTPPLLSSFFSTTSTPATPKPTAASLPGLTSLKPSSAQLAPISNMPVSGIPSSSSNSLFNKPFSLQPSSTGTDSAVPKDSNAFTPPPLGYFGDVPLKPESRPLNAVFQPIAPPLVSPGTPKSPLSPPSPFTSSLTAGSSIPSAPSVLTRSPATMSTPPPMEDGMQKECYMLVDMMHTELDHFRTLAEMVAKRREMLSKSAGGSRRKEDLGNHEKWAPCDGAQFGALLMQLEQDIFELEAYTEKQKEDIRDIRKSMIKAGTRREEIARFNKAKSDNEFTRMLKSRTLGPEHLENQTQLRRNIRAMSAKVDQLEDQLRAHKKRLSEVNSGRPTLKPPSLDTIHRTYRNIDIALLQQTDEVALLNARFLKLNLSAPAHTTNSPARDPRLPKFSPHSRPSIITPDVAVTTAAALNAERSAHKLKTMLLKSRREPLLNIKAKEAFESGKKVPMAYTTPKSATGIPSINSGGIQFTTPIIRGPLFAGAAPPSPSVPDTGRWDTQSFPEDDFRATRSLSSGVRRGGTPARKHGFAPSVKKSPVPGSPETGGTPKASSPAASFDWGPLPTFNKPSFGLPGFDKVVPKSPTMSSPALHSGGIRLGINPPSLSSVFGSSAK